MTPVKQAAALAEFPELQRLIDLRESGWLFFPTVADRQVVEVRGVRTWPDGWADALRIRYVTDAAGIRSDYTGAVTWEQEGTLTEVIDGLIALPVPDDRVAPRVATGRGPWMWTP